MKPPDIHFHHDSLEGIYGALLEEGDLLEPGDCYDAPGGEWEVFPTHGICIGQGVSAQWVRPGMPD